MNLKNIISIVLTIGYVLSSFTAVSAIDAKPIPNTFIGTLKFKNSSGEFNVPENALLEAFIDNTVKGSTTVKTDGKFNIDVKGTFDDDGKKITFKVNNRLAEQNPIFYANNPPPPRNLDLMFLLISNYTNWSINTTANDTIEINAQEEVDTIIDLVTRTDTTDGIINIMKSNDFPDTWSKSFSLTPFGKYFTITASDNLNASLSWIKLRFYYTQAELDASGLDENTLKISWYDETADSWKTLNTGSPDWVFGTGVEPADTGGYAGYVWVNVSHLSTFGIIGNPPDDDGDGNGGGGGGGGGGGVTSGEDASNIQFREKYDFTVYKNVVTSYRFRHSGNPIKFVNITGNINAGLITTAIEVLKNTSTIVTSPSPDTVYHNINIWVGSSGFAVPKNIKHAEIIFVVEKAWLDSSGFEPGDITLRQWYDDKWNRLVTKEIGEDDEYTYFEAKTNRFSPFAIAAVKSDKKEKPPKEALVSEVTPTSTPAATARETSPGPGIMTAVSILIVLYVTRKRK